MLLRSTKLSSFIVWIVTSPQNHLGVVSKSNNKTIYM